MAKKGKEEKASTGNPYLDKDGYINVKELAALAREIDRKALKKGLKDEEIYYARKLIVKHDTERAKNQGEVFTKKRAQPIKTRKKMPTAGSRVSMMVVLHLYKGLDGSFAGDVKLALKAIEKHNKHANVFIEKNKEQAKKKREKLNKEFDTNVDVVSKVLIKGGVKEKDLAIGQSMMGKTVLVKLPNGGYISVGKADKERFDKAKHQPEETKAKETKPKKDKKKDNKVVVLDDVRKKKEKDKKNEKKDKQAA